MGILSSEAGARVHECDPLMANPAVLSTAVFQVNRDIYYVPSGGLFTPNFIEADQVRGEKSTRGQVGQQRCTHERDIGVRQKVACARKVRKGGFFPDFGEQRADGILFFFHGDRRSLFFFFFFVLFVNLLRGAQREKAILSSVITPHF